MEVLTELEEERALRLFGFGYGSTEIVLITLKGRNCDLVDAMRRDVRKIFVRERKRKNESKGRRSG